MKLNRELAQVQAMRLQACPTICPNSREGRTEIVDCLLRNCQDAEHAKRTITHVLDNALHVQNLTAELAAAARLHRTASDAPTGCERCNGGEDLNTHEQIWLSHVIVERNGVEGAQRCSCERGQWLAARDRQSQAEAERTKPVKAYG